MLIGEIKEQFCGKVINRWKIKQLIFILKIKSVKHLNNKNNFG